MLEEKVSVMVKMMMMKVMRVVIGVLYLSFSLLQYGFDPVEARPILQPSVILDFFLFFIFRNEKHVYACCLRVAQAP